MAYKVTEAAGTLEHDGKTFNPGDTLPDLSDAQIAQLEGVGAIEQVEAKAAKAPKE